MVAEAPPVQRAFELRVQASLQLPRARRMPLPVSALPTRPLEEHPLTVIGSPIAPYAGRLGCVRLCHADDGGVLGHHPRALLRAEFRPLALPRLAVNVPVARQLPPARNRACFFQQSASSLALRVGKQQQTPLPEHGHRNRQAATALAQLPSLGSCLEISCGASCARASNCA